MRIMNMYYDPVHDLAQVIEPTCTYDTCTSISSLYAHDPHHAHLVEIKHNAYMRALHSRDAYAYTARLDRVLRPRLVHMTYHSRDKTP